MPYRTLLLLFPTPTRILAAILILAAAASGSIVGLLYRDPTTAARTLFAISLCASVVGFVTVLGVIDARRSMITAIRLDAVALAVAAEYGTPPDLSSDPRDSLFLLRRLGASDEAVELQRAVTAYETRRPHRPRSRG
jgi:hypothetical protein